MLFILSVYCLFVLLNTLLQSTFNLNFNLIFNKKFQSAAKLNNLFNKNA